MTTIDKITDILYIILTIKYIVLIIILVIIHLEPLFKPKKYYRVEYHYDHFYVNKSIIKAKTPKQAIDKLIHKYQREFPLNEVTDIISCKEVDYYICLKEVEEND